MAGISIGSVSVTVVPEVRRFATEVRRQTLPQAERIGKEIGRRIAEGINEQVDRIQIRVSMGQTMARLARLNQMLDKLDGREVNIKINVDFGDSAAQLLALQQILRNIERRITINVRTDADRSIASMLRLGNSAGSASRGIGGLGRGILRLPWPALASGAVAGGAALIQLAANLAPVIGLTAAIPAVAASAIAAFGTLALAFTGTSAAASSVKRELKGVRPELESIKNAASAGLFTPLRGQITAVAAAITGPLRTGVRGVAREFGLAGRSVLQFARSAATVQSIRVGFAGLRDVIRQLRPAVAPLLAGFRDLAIAAIPALKQMAAGTADLVTRFGQWMSQLAASGRVPEIIANALSVLRSLGALLADVGGIIRSVFEAARQAGSGLFGILGPALDQLNAFLKTAAAQQALQAFFYSINAIGRALAPIVGIIGSVAAQLLTALYPVVQAALPFVNQLVAAFGRIVPSLTPILAPLGAFIASLGLLPILTPIINLIAQTAVEFGGALVQALTATLPSLQQIVMAVASLLPAFAPLIPVVPRLLMAVLPLVPVVAQLAAAMATFLAPALRLVATVITKVVTVITAVLTPILRFLVGYLSIVAAGVRLYFTGIQTIVRVVGAVFQWLWNVAIGPALRAIAAAAMWLWNNAIRPAFNGILTVLKVVGAILFVVLVGPFIIAFNLIKAAALFLWRNVISPAFRGIAALIRWAWTVVIRPTLNALAGFFRSVIAPVFRWIYNSVIRPIWNAVGTAIRFVWNSIIRPALNALNAIFRNVIAPVFRWIVNTIIKPLWNAAGNAIRSVWNNVISKVFEALKTGVGKVRSAFSTAVSAIGRIWDGIRDKTKKPVQFVVNTVYNNGIRKAWNLIAGLVKLPQLPSYTFAGGGVVPAAAYGVLPGYSPGRDTMLAAVSPGEGWLRPDATRAVGPGFIHGLNRAAVHGGVSGAADWLASMGGQHFDIGGIVGRIKGAVSGAKNLVVKGAGDILAKGASFAAKKILDPILAQVNRLGGDSPWAQAIKALPKRMIEGFLGWVKKFIDPKLGGDATGVVKAAKSMIGQGDDRGPNNNWITRKWGMVGAPWCAMFVSEAISKAGAHKKYPGHPSAAVASFVGAMKHVGLGSGRAGDLAAYRGSGHINVIEAKAGGGYMTIGGNQNAKVQRGVRGGQSSILRPNFSLGGIVADQAKEIFRHEAPRNADKHEMDTPLVRLMRSLSPATIRPVAEAITRNRLNVVAFDSGGFLPTGPSLVYNGTGRPEPVLTADQFSTLAARGDRHVSVMDHATVIVQDPVDVDMLAQRTEFAARSASF